MKKEYNFSLNDNSYVITENGDVIFSMDVNSLDFKGKDFYEAIYKDVSAEDDKLTILLNNKLSEDDTKSSKTALFTYQTLNDIIMKINDEFNKQEDVAEKNTIEDDLNDEKLPF